MSSVVEPLFGVTLSMKVRANIFDWITGHPGGDTPELHELLLLTLRETPSLMLIGFFWTQIGGIAAFIATRSVWAGVWITCDIILLILRVSIRKHHMAFVTKQLRPPHEVLLLAYLAWLLSIALGSFGCLVISDVRTTVLGTLLIMGYVGFAASRFAAVPRFADTILGILFGALLVGLLFSPMPHLWMLAPLIPGAAVAFHILMRLNHDIIIGAFREQLEHRRLSSHDPLTGLPNLLQFREQIAALCEQFSAPGRTSNFAVLAVDLDGFKAINDRHGHAAGDQLLQSVAQRLQNAVRLQDSVCRIGGDEFVILLPGTNRRTAIEITQRVIAACARPYALDGVAMACVGASVGIALAPEHGSDPEQLMSRADRALYAVKRSGKNNWHVSGDDKVALPPYPELRFKLP